MAEVARHLRVLAGRVAAWGSLAARTRSLRAARSIWAIAADATTIPGWVAGAAAREVAVRSLLLDGEATIVEVGVFMGRSTVLLAAPRRARGRGRIYRVDPFDASGDAFSVPVYRRELERVGSCSMEDAFRRNIAARGLDPWVEVLKGSSAAIAGRWTRPIDLLLLDADHSPEGAKAVFDAWSPLVRPGGQVVLHNTGERVYAEGHDGNYRIATADLRRPPFHRLEQIAHTSYAIRGG